MPDDALHRIDKHEAVCTQRWESLERSNAVFHERLNAISNRMWAAAIGLIVLALSAAGTLVVIVLTLMQKAPK
jgi:hypothetical protein